MISRFFKLTVGFLSGAVLATAQPGPISTSNSTNLVFAASTLLTNGLAGLSGAPANMMVATVFSSSMQGGAVSLEGSQAWGRRYNGPGNDEDQGFAITADKDGNIIVGGYSYASASGYDYFTIKYAPDGTGLWTNRYDGPTHGSDQIKAVATDGSGGVYVGGLSSGKIVTIKYTPAGAPVWTNAFGSGLVFFGGLAVDNAGNSYVIPNGFDTESFVMVKYDPNGNPVWTNSFNLTATSSDASGAISVDALGNIYEIGTSYDSTSGVSIDLAIKYDSNGSVLWIKTVPSATVFKLDLQGNMIVVGDLAAGTSQHQHPIVKLSSQGTVLWMNMVAGADYAGGGVPEVATDPAGNVFLVAGTPATSTADYTMFKFSSAGVPLWTNRFTDPNSGGVGAAGAGTDNAGNLYLSVESASPGGGNNFNFVTLKYAANGVAVWTNRYNGPANGADLPRVMTVDKAGGVIVTGTSGGTAFSSLDCATVKYADNLRYVPPPGFVGQDTITFTAVDSLGNTASGSLVVNVTEGPSAPFVPPSVVAPASYQSAAGNGSLNTLVRSTGAPRTYQMQLTPAALGGLPAGSRITQLRFRLSASETANFPVSSPVTWPDYEVTLARAANAIGSMSTTFQSNLLNPVLVKDGPLTIGANQLTAGGNPNQFGTLIVLDTPYVYQGGDLVMLFSHNGSDSTNTAFLDAASTASAGYGTSFRAISANAFEATSGSAANVTIVEIVYVPTITQTIAFNGNQLVINGAGGLANARYRILTATNFALPMSQWTPIATNLFTGSGAFSFTNVIQPNLPAQYFRVSLP